eukprot:gene28235-37246_t
MFINKQIIELGGGLGLVSILLDKLNSLDHLTIESRHPIVCSDGDLPTLELLDRNIQLTNCSNYIKAEKLYWDDEL